MLGLVELADEAAARRVAVAREHRFVVHAQSPQREPPGFHAREVRAELQLFQGPRRSPHFRDVSAIRSRTPARKYHGMNERAARAERAPGLYGQV